MPEPLTDNDYRWDLDQVEYNCAEDHDGAVVVAAVSSSGQPLNVYDLGCAEDTWKLPGEYDDRRLVGTHWLSDEALRELFPDDTQDFHPESFTDDCRTNGCKSESPRLVVGIEPEGGMQLLCLECAQDVIDRPTVQGNIDVTLHGTHVLADALLREIYPEDFEDEEG
jgi:hypothetical protein